MTQSPYWQQLISNQTYYQTEIEKLLKKYQAQPTGNGYIDLIVGRNIAIQLIEELAQLPIVVSDLSWWCLCTEESKTKLGCPHGMGGPLNRFGDGWFSECVHYPFFELAPQGIELENRSIEADVLAKESSKILADYLENRLLHESFYSECLHPGLWLYVPNEWRRQTYAV